MRRAVRAGTVLLQISGGDLAEPIQLTDHPGGLQVGPDFYAHAPFAFGWGGANRSEARQQAASGRQREADRRGLEATPTRPTSSFSSCAPAHRSSPRRS
jgi:hypothetical protein